MKLINKDKKLLLSNFLSLTLLQLFSYILPLITLPYLVNVLSTEYYGLVVFSQSFIVFFSIFVDFGFNLSAVKAIAIYQKNKLKLQQIYSSVMFIKTILLIVSFFLLIIITNVFDKFQQYRYIYFLSFLYVIGQAYFPIWFFQGVEKMKFITVINIIVKIFFTCSIFIFVKRETDFYLVPILNGLGNILGAILSIYIVYTKFKVRFITVSINQIIYYFKDSFQYFLSNISVNFYTGVNTVILGMVTTNNIVAYYNMAEQLYKAMLAFTGPLTAVLYPYMTRTKNIVFFKYILIGVASICTIGCIFMINLDQFILTLFYNNNVNYFVIKIFDIFTVSFIIATISCMLGYPFLGSIGYINHANNSIIFGAIFHLLSIICLYLFDSISIMNIALLVLATESVVLFYRIFYSFKIIRKGKLNENSY
ncbi:oligosaccharide flippase family protein [Volucribacter amazonae]|uniref:PST family polysaccharide transporter n=1 Tax=Volucribacter amazonae TaxID=256731 RepID=A0A9X4P9A7_9PAST|nr:oligosaccharide flippase family protein [Volucribacter amazonae]MDG6894873.1 hypothetical protein [Volucribacter amazonae]